MRVKPALQELACPNTKRKKEETIFFKKKRKKRESGEVGEPESHNLRDKAKFPASSFAPPPPPPPLPSRRYTVPSGSQSGRQSRAVEQGRAGCGETWRNEVVCIMSRAHKQCLELRFFFKKKTLKCGHSAEIRRTVADRRSLIGRWVCGEETRGT